MRGHRNISQKSSREKAKVVPRGSTNRDRVRGKGVSKDALVER
jgi:hypothetical protein